MLSLEVQLCFGSLDASVPRPGLCCTQVSFCSAELLQVLVFATNNLSQSPFVGHSEGKGAERDKRVFLLGLSTTPLPCTYLLMIKKAQKSL